MSGRCGRTPSCRTAAILIPGVITHCSVLVEHPELVAERSGEYAEVVGRENVIAGTDCGFATFAGADEIASQHRVGEASSRW